MKLVKAGLSLLEIALACHAHGVVDLVVSTPRVLYAIKLSFAALMFTALFQLFVFWVSGSIALYEIRSITLEMPQPQFPWVLLFFFLEINLIKVSLTVTAEQKALPVC